MENNCRFFAEEVFLSVAQMACAEKADVRAELLGLPVRPVWRAAVPVPTYGMRMLKTAIPTEEPQPLTLSSETIRMSLQKPTKMSSDLKWIPLVGAIVAFNQYCDNSDLLSENERLREKFASLESTLESFKTGAIELYRENKAYKAAARAARREANELMVVIKTQTRRIRELVIEDLSNYVHKLDLEDSLEISQSSNKEHLRHIEELEKQNAELRQRSEEQNSRQHGEMMMMQDRLHVLDNKNRDLQTTMQRSVATTALATVKPIRADVSVQADLLEGASRCESPLSFPSRSSSSSSLTTPTTTSTSPSLSSLAGLWDDDGESLDSALRRFQSERRAADAVASSAAPATTPRLPLWQRAARSASKSKPTAAASTPTPSQSQNANRKAPATLPRVGSLPLPSRASSASLSLPAQHRQRSLSVSVPRGATTTSSLPQRSRSESSTSTATTPVRALGLAPRVLFPASPLEPSSPRKSGAVLSERLLRLAKPVERHVTKRVDSMRSAC